MTLVVEQVHVFRECATGPLRDVRISGTLHKTDVSTDGTVVFHGTGSAAYRLTFAVSHRASIDATLANGAGGTRAQSLTVQSHVRQDPGSVQLEGRTSADFAQLAPFLDLLLPMDVICRTSLGRCRPRGRSRLLRPLPWRQPGKSRQRSSQGQRR